MCFQQKLSKQNQTWGGSTTVKKQVAGTASSVAFTPLQVRLLLSLPTTPSVCLSMTTSLA